MAVVTQPDRPSGRGQRPGSPPVADAARELGLRLVQTERASAEPVDADVGAVVAFGQMVRAAAPRRIPALQPASVAPAPLAGRGARRAGAHGRRRRDGRVRDRAHGRARRRARSTAARDSMSGPTTTPAAVRARALELGTPLLAEALRGGTHGEEQPDEPASPTPTRSSLGTAGSTGPGPPPTPPISCARSRRTSAHAAELDGRPVTVWRARAGPGGGEPGSGRPAAARSAAARACSRCSSSSPRAGGGWPWPTTCAGSGGPRSGRHERPRRRVRGRAADVRGGRLHRPRLPRRGRPGGARRPRPPARDAARVRHRAARADARPCARDARGAAARRAPADAAGGAARRCLPAPLRGGRPAARRRERDGRAVQARRRRPHRRARERRAAPHRRGGEDGSRACPSRCATPTRTGSSRSGSRCSARPTPRR